MPPKHKFIQSLWSAAFATSLFASTPAIATPGGYVWKAGESREEIKSQLAYRRLTQQGPTIAERVKKLLVEHLGVEADKVVDSANCVDDLGADSLDTVELLMAVEEEFGIEISDDQFEKIVTVGQLVKFLEKATGNK